MNRLSSLLVLLLCSHVVAAEKPNVVVILVDDMGYGDPGCFNPKSKIPTPNIDQLARDGMRFTDAHASGPLCHVSRYGLITGRYPWRTNVGQWSKRAVIEPNRMTLPSLMNSQGYRTAMVGKWHLGFNENGYDKPLPGGPVDCGFDSFFGIRASTDIPPYFYIRNNKAVEPPTNNIEARSTNGWSPIQGEFWRAGGIAPNLNLKDVLPRFTEEAIDVIHDQKRDRAARPLMMYLAYPAPHTPWLPAPEFDGKSKAGMYGDFLVMVDAMIGRVLKTLDENGMRENTIVVFSSDNGPVWYENDVQRFGHDSSGGLRGMKADAWEAGHRMPFIVRWPGTVQPGSTSNHLICFTDLMATFADLVNYQLPPDAAPDSFSFLNVLHGSQSDNEPVRPHLMTKAGGFFALRVGDWKLIDGLGSGGFSKPRRVKATQNGPKVQLYNLKNDIGETTNLALEEPARVKEMLRLLRQLKNTRSTRP
ncbi:MAG: arylsulfatase [Planctomycetaceae bacterium]